MPSKTTSKRKTAKTVDAALVERTRTALLALPAELVEAKTCQIVKRDNKTIGYLSVGARKIRVDVPKIGGGVERISVTSAKDVAKVVAALQQVAKRQATKAATASK